MERPSPARDRYFMKNALNISLRGIGNTWPNPSVGAVVVKNDQIISRGWTQPGGKPHAEVVALKKNNLFGATLYTTLEPCSHYGKTPPCVDQIIKSEINRVVIGLKDPNPKINGEGIRKLKKGRIKVTTGVLKNEIKKTKEMYKIINKFEIKNSLIILDKLSKDKIYKSVRNIPSVKITDVNHFSAFDIVKFKKIVFTESSVKELEKRYT